MIIKPETLTQKERYKLSIGTILPRPIAWVSTMDVDGGLNLAPFSYFTAACTDPLTLIFCPQIPKATGVKKDTLRNIEATGEFVINLTNEATAVAMNRSATVFPPNIDEFEWAGVTPAAGETIRVPRVAEAPAAFECRLRQIVHIHEGPGGGAAVFGEVTCIHIADDLYVDGYVVLERLKPIGRLAGNSYTRVTDVFDMARLPVPDDGLGG